MTIKDARKEQRKSIKNRSLKDRISYFWEYFGLKTVAAVMAVAIVIVFAVNMATKKEYAFTGVFFGAQAQSSADSYLKEFERSANINPDKYTLSVQCSPDVQMDQQITQDIYNSMESFSAMVATKSVDCFAGNAEFFLYYAYMGYATDLRTVLSPEEMDALSPYLHYIDNTLIEQQENADEGLADAYAKHPDSTKPELMQEPVPVAISLDAADEAFLESYRFGENAVIGICTAAPYPKNALAFLRYCLIII